MDFSLMVINHIGTFYFLPSPHLDNHYHTHGEGSRILIASSLTFSWLNYGLSIGFIKRDIEKWF